MATAESVPVGLDEVRGLLDAGLRAAGLEADEVEPAAAHLLDCELRGLRYGGLARLLSVAELLAARPGPREPVRVVRAGPSSAAIDGADRIGYVVGQFATDVAAGKAAETGLAVVGANRTWYTGMLSYYAEQLTRQGFVVLLASNATPWVAPHGGTEPRFGTNPMCVGFPSADGADVIWDIGTSAVTHAEVVLAQRTGNPLAEGVALDRNGDATVEPAAALDGALLGWGGARGSGLGLVVQMLGMLAGSPVAPGTLHDFGMVIAVWQPDLLGDASSFTERIAEYSEWVRAARGRGGEAIRMPFDRSRRVRTDTLARGVADVRREVLDAVRALAGTVSTGG